MSRVKDNLNGSNSTGGSSIVNGEIEQYVVARENDIQAGDIVEFINQEIEKDTK